MVIVGNTIRLDIQNRRDEIEVTKLVGGSDAFVRRPFLYNGFWYGLGGGGYGLGHHRSSPSAFCATPSGAWQGSTAAAFSSAALGPEASAILLGSGHCAGLAGVLHRRHPASARDRTDLI